MEQPSNTYSAVEEFERLYVRPREGRTLIVGSRVYQKSRADRRLLYKDAVGWDALEGEGVDEVIDLEQPLGRKGYPQFDHVDCVSVLEHSRRPWLLAENVERLMLPGATLYVAVPFVWRVHQYPKDYWRFTVDGVREVFPRIEWSRLVYAHTVLSKPGEKVTSTRVDEYPYFARAEVLGFGVRPQ